MNKFIIIPEELKQNQNEEEVRYDKDGSMINGPLNGKMTEFVYDCRNRLIQKKGLEQIISLIPITIKSGTFFQRI